jgi:hypothetical protein
MPQHYNSVENAGAGDCGDHIQQRLGTARGADADRGGVEPMRELQYYPFIIDKC